MRTYKFKTLRGLYRAASGQLTAEALFRGRVYLSNGRGWCSVNSDGWAGVFVVVRSFLGETRRYYGYTLKQAERAYRSEFGLTGKKLVRL